MSGTGNLAQDKWVARVRWRLPFRFCVSRVR